MEITYIYTLNDPETNEPRYVGRTRNLKRRLYEHHQDKRLKNNHKSNWIRSLLNRGLRVKMEVLEECDETNWSEREKYWVSQFKNLTNMTEGGEGEFKRNRELTIQDDVRKRISKTVSELHKNGVYENSYKIFSKNLRGKKKSKKSSSKFCGVYKTRCNNWLAQIRNRSKSVYIGIYKTEEEAAIAYDLKSIELFGSEAVLNFPDMVGKLTPPIRTSSKNSSKYKGINFQSNRWVATIFVDGKKKYLGSFLTEEEAYVARCVADKASV